MAITQYTVEASPNTPYFTPTQKIPVGTATNPQPNGKPIPKLFQPLKIRGLEFQNRVWLSPLGQASSENGKFTPWHIALVGGIVTNGPGLSFVEATAVTPEGRITPNDAGLWSDDQIDSLRQVTQYAHSQNQKIAIQLSHGGPKSSIATLWLPTAGTGIPASEGGWPDKVVAASPIPHDEKMHLPKEISKSEMAEIVVAFADAAKRAVTAGIDVIEIHGAHGFLINSFMSPQTNKRVDDYGGSFENRIRFPLEVVDAIRAVIPSTMPLFFRISATEWLEEALPNEASWTIEDTQRFAPILAAHGVDLIDISSGGNSSQQKFRFTRPAYQSNLSEEVKRAVQGVKVAGSDAQLLVSAVGGISTGAIAAEVLDKEWADVVFVGRYLQQNAGLVTQFARELDVEIQIPVQIGWAFTGRGSKSSKQEESK